MGSRLRKWIAVVAVALLVPVPATGLSGPAQPEAVAQAPGLARSLAEEVASISPVPLDLFGGGIPMLAAPVRQHLDAAAGAPDGVAAAAGEYGNGRLTFLKTIDEPTELVGGTFYVDQNWAVSAPLGIRNATLVFNSTADAHFQVLITGDGSLAIHDSVVRQRDEQKRNFSVIRSQAPVSVSDSDFSGVALVIEKQNGAPSHVSRATFHDSLLGLVVRDTDVRVDTSRFYRNNVALSVLCDSAGCVMARPVIEHNIFELNTNAVSLGRSGGPTVQRNVFVTNLVSVNGASNSNATIQDNNFTLSFMAAYTGTSGVAVGGVSIIDPSTNTLSSNWYSAPRSVPAEADNADMGLMDVADAQPRETPPDNHADLGLPAGFDPLFPPTVVTDHRTWTGTVGPLAGAVVVTQLDGAAGNLTIEGATLLAAGNIVGSRKGGSLQIERSGTTPTTIRNNGIVVLGNTAAQSFDSVEGLRIWDDSVFGTALSSYKARGVTIRDVEIRNQTGLGISTLSTTGDAPNVFAIVEDVKMRDIGNIALLSLGGLTLDDADFTSVLAGPTTLLATTKPAALSDVQVHSAAIGLVDGLSSSWTMRRSVISNTGIAFFPLATAGGPLQLLEKTTIGWNLMGIVAVAGIVGSDNLNLFNNSLASIYALGARVNAVELRSVVNLQACIQDDEKFAEPGSTAEVVAPSGAPFPPSPNCDLGLPNGWSWPFAVAGHVVTGEKSLSGTLDGPWIAKRGGRIRIENATVDARCTTGPCAGMSFTIGVHSNSKIKLYEADVRHAIGIALHGVEASIVRSHVRDSIGVGVAVDRRLTSNPIPTFEWNRFENFSTHVFVALHTGNFVVKNSHFERTGTAVSASVGARVVVEGSNFLTLPTATARAQRGHLTVRESNFFGDTLALADSGVDTDTAVDVRNNWWGHATGPFHPANQPNGLGVAYSYPGGLLPPPAPLVSPWKTAPVNVPPALSITASDTTPTDLEEVQFGSSVTTIRGFDPVTYLWDFGGDGASTLAAPTHTFSDDGLYDVRLTVTDAFGGTASRSIQVQVANVGPAVSIDPLAGPLFDDTPVEFVARGSDPDGVVATYAWTFDGTHTATGPVVSRTFARGDHTATVVATDDDGATASATVEFSVRSRGNNAPDVDFAWAPGIPNAGSPVAFTDLSVDPEGDVLGPYEWDFGDGTTSTARHPTHVYAASGSYTVRLRVWDEAGAVGEATKTLRVNAPPVPAFTWSPEHPEIYLNRPVNFTDLSTDLEGPIVAWAWDFGEQRLVNAAPAGNWTSTQRHPVHTFSTSGDHWVKLTVTDANGEARSITQNVRVRCSPSGVYVGPTPNTPNPPGTTCIEAGTSTGAGT